jgi:antitoxin component HigA of HigAB toxin-antitoxin module
MDDYAQQRELENAPIKERLGVVTDLLIDYRDQLQKLLDLYLEGVFQKELLVERKQRLEGTISALEAERTDLMEHLETHEYSPQQIEDIKQVVTEISLGVAEADNSFEKQKQIIEVLDVRAALTVENDEKIAYVRCAFKNDPDALLIAPLNIYRRSRLGSQRPGTARQSVRAERTAPRPRRPARRLRAPFR